MSEKVNKLINLLSKKNQVILKRMWDYYQTNTNGEKFIYYMIDDFSDVASDFISEYSPSDFVETIRKSIERGKFNNDHIYFEIIPFEIFHSFNDLRSSDYFSYEELAEYILTANDDMGNPDIREILNESGIPEYDFKFIIKCKRRTDNAAKTMIALKDYIEIQTAGEYDMEVAGCDITKVE